LTLVTDLLGPNGLKEGASGAVAEELPWQPSHGEVDVTNTGLRKRKNAIYINLLLGNDSQARNFTPAVDNEKRKYSYPHNRSWRPIRL
jgi:hypothetical protein